MVVIPLMGWCNVDDDDACGPQCGELKEQTTFLSWWWLLPYHIRMTIQIRLFPQ